MGGVCLCGMSDSTAIWYDSHRANVCNESAPSVACGQNAACDADSDIPFCLDTTGVTSGHGVTPVFGKTNSSVTCQVRIYLLHHFLSNHKSIVLALMTFIN